MPMIPFVSRFRDLGKRETRSLILSDYPDLPDGEYGFFEFYCDDPGCDCRRVIIMVMRPETGWGQAWATINYGWESPDYYKEWIRTSLNDPGDMKGPNLDALGEQTRYSPMLLRLFEEEILPSPGYIERLQRHYTMFKAVVDGEQVKRAREESRRLENRKKRLRDPKRRSRRLR